MRRLPLRAPGPTACGAALLVAPPKSGKTVMMQHIAHAIAANYPESHMMVLLVDERPEEVTDFRRNVPAHVLASSNDEDLDRHLALGQFAIERAKRVAPSLSLDLHDQWRGFESNGQWRFTHRKLIVEWEETRAVTVKDAASAGEGKTS